MEQRQESSITLLRAPCEKPPFTLNELKKAIPPHCFNRSLLRSFSYILHDLLFITLLFFLAITVIPKLPSPLQRITWPLYWFAQGSILFGVWVIAHECGHQAFSNYSLLNNTVGLILHSLLLVPYFSWKYSHRRHHSNTASIDRDEAYVPKLRSSLPWFSTYLNNPFGRVLTLTLILTIGWPLYLISNLAGRPYHRFACHFDPYSPIYNESERAQILISDAGILAVVYILYRFAASFSLTILIRLYVAPLLVVNGWLILITYLQHTHPALPHYDSAEWDWLRGALSTVDRDYGFLNGVFHNLPDTHVAHHLFSTMPHYHAMEATKAIRPLLGDYYRLDDTPIVKALWREATECLYVKLDEGEGRRKGGGSGSGVYWYHNEL